MTTRYNYSIDNDIKKFVHFVAEHAVTDNPRPQYVSSFNVYTKSACADKANLVDRLLSKHIHNHRVSHEFYGSSSCYIIVTPKE